MIESIAPYYTLCPDYKDKEFLMFDIDLRPMTLTYITNPTKVKVDRYNYSKLGP